MRRCQAPPLPFKNHQHVRSLLCPRSTEPHTWLYKESPALAQDSKEGGTW